MKPRFANSLITALTFTAFGLIWIYFTDDLFLGMAGTDMERYHTFQHYKGTIFVVLASILVFWMSFGLSKSLHKVNKEVSDNNAELQRLYTQTLEQENALKLSYERFALLSKATGDAIWEYNFADGSSYANEALKDLFGYESTELRDNFNWWTSNLHPDDKLRVIARTETALNGKEIVWHDEYRFRAKDGSYKVVYDRGFILRDEQGKPRKLIGAMQDVTLQRRLQQELINEKVARQKEIAQATIQAQEAERKQLGEELHDNINQLLATTKLYLDHSLNNPQFAEEFIRKSIGNIVMIIEEIRALSRSLTPPSLGDLGLKDALQDLCTNIEVAGTIEFDLQMKGISDSEISNEKKISIYRIVQEQLNNILKHANASLVKIILEKQDEEIVLIIKDNGNGFDPKTARYGLGLHNIRNRAELYGGSMELSSAPGKGCTLRVCLHI